MRKNTLELLYIKNLSFRLIPALFYIFFAFFFISKYPIVEYFVPHKLNSTEQISEYTNNKTNVIVSPKEIKFTGYTYTENGKVKGGYYYGFLNDRCMFFLIKGNGNFKEVIKNPEIKGKLLNNNTELSLLLRQFSIDTNLDMDTLSSLTSNYLISEVDYPTLLNTASLLLIIIPLLYCTYVVISTIIFVLIPWHNPMAKCLSAFGDKKRLFLDVNTECYNHTIYDNKNILVTDSYMIYSPLLETKVVNISDIRYISKHIYARSNFSKNRHIIYKLSISTNNNLLFNFKFTDEIELDEVMEVLITLCPNIDTKSIDYWTETT